MKHSAPCSNPWKQTAAGLLAALALAACRSAPPPAVQTSPPPLNRYDIGSILHVNEKSGYVIVRCAILPSEHEELNVVREEREVARIRLAGPRRPPYLAADVLAGTPRKGDRVRLEKRTGMK